VQPGSASAPPERPLDEDYPGFRARDDALIPDFCNGGVIINVALIAQLLAIIISVVSPPPESGPLKQFLLHSLYVQWVGMASAIALCLGRGYLNRLPPVRAVLMAYLVLLCVAFAVAEVRVWVMWAVNLLPTPHPEWYGYFHLENLTIAAMVDALALRYFIARHQLRRSALAEAQARMQALKYRIRPHFLFNAMNIVASLTRREPARAEAAIEDMADVFRLMLDDSKTLVPVRNELDVTRKYLALEQLRLEDRLRVHWELGELPRMAKMPVLMLQLVLENAIYYGVEPLPDGGDVFVSLHITDGTLELDVRSPATEVGDDRMQKSNETLENLALRLSGHYGEAARLTSERIGNELNVHIVLPAFGGTE